MKEFFKLCVIMVAGMAAIIQLQWHALEQQFPCGERGQWQCGRFGEVERGRLARYQPFVHKMELRIAAWPGDITGVVDLVAGREQAGVLADRFDHPGGVPTEYAGCFERGRIGGRPLLAVDRVHRDGLDPDQQVAATRRQRRGEVDIAEGRGGFTTQGDSFHLGSGWVRGSIIEFLTFQQIR